MVWGPVTKCCLGWKSFPLSSNPTLLFKISRRLRHSGPNGRHCTEQTDPTLLKFTLPRRNRFRNSCTERRNINNMKVTLYSGKSQNTVNTPSHKVQERCLSESKFKDLPYTTDLSSTDSHGIFLRDATISDKRKYKGWNMKANSRLIHTINFEQS